MTKEPKLNQEHIDAIIDTMTFHYERVGETNTTGCWSKLPNGFQIGYGESNAFNLEDFDQTIGNQSAMEQCMVDTENKLFFVEAYRLKMTGTLTDVAALKMQASMEANG